MMEFTAGSSELLQLAHLLKVSAGAARDIAVIRGKDIAAIETAADQTVTIAALLEAIAGAVPGTYGGNFTPQGRDASR